MSDRLNCIIMGAAGRDFHDFQVFFQTDPHFRVCAFTAAQIPFIASRSFPKSLAGPGYDADIPIHLEEELPELIRELAIDFVFLSYSDLPNEQVMRTAALVQASGASFALLGPGQTQLIPNKPTIAITAVRTGAGKSPLTQWLARQLRDHGRRVAVIRHPMPYGDLERQRCQRFASNDDLDRHQCTIEEREEYQPYVDLGIPLFAGAVYSEVLAAAEAEADVLLWDGGNNDAPFLRPGLMIVVIDALRPGHETTFYPGETNLRMADLVAINKVSRARPGDIAAIRNCVERLNPGAAIVESDLEIAVDYPERIRGHRVIVVEDGPTITHGGMPSGAGLLAAREFEAAEILDPRDFSIGSIAQAFQDYPHIDRVLPALGYSEHQVQELNDTINASEAEAVVDASPARLEHIVKTRIPIARVRYAFQQTSGESIMEVASRFLASHSQ